MQRTLRLTLIIEQPVRHIGQLLNFANRQPAANRMDRPGRNKTRIARPRRSPSQHVDNIAVQRGGTDPLTRGTLAQTKSNRRSWVRAKNAPHLGLTAFVSVSTRISVIRMHLHR